MEYPWLTEAPAVKRAACAARGRRFTDRFGGAIATVVFCLAIGGALSYHPPVLPNVPPPAPQPVPHHPRAAKPPHVHVRGYLIYRAARWAFRRGW